MNRRSIKCKIDNFVDLKKDEKQLQVFMPFADRYKKLCLQFDGVLDDETWEKSKLKILFLLKDSYRPVNENGEVKNKNRFSTYVFDLQNKKACEINDTTWKKVLEWANTISVKFGCGEIKSLKNVAFMNINKLAFSEADGYETQKKDLAIAVRDDKDLLKSQFKNISPNIIVCGNTGKYLFRFLDVLMPEPIYSAKNKNRNSLNVYVLEEDGKRTFVFDVYHPSYRATTTSEELEIAIEKIKEFI